MENNSLANTLSAPNENRGNIFVLIDTIKANKNFSKLIIYSLNTLKSYLVVQNQSQATENSVSILQNDFINVIKHVYEHNIGNEELQIKIAEILFYITSSCINKSREFEILLSNEGIALIKNMVSSLPEKHIEAYKIMIKNIQVLIESIQNQNNNGFNIEEYFSIIISLIDKFNDNVDLMIYLLETLKKMSSLKKFKEISSTEFIDKLFNIISTTTSQKIATLGLQILDTVIKSLDNRELIRASKPISMVVRLLTKFKDDNLLSYHACGFLSKLLEKEDVYVFLKIMKLKNMKSLEREFENDFTIQRTLTEINEMLSNQDEESFNILKKNITRVLILMSKDKNFLQLLKDINSLDIFVGLLKSDLEMYSKMENKTNEEINIFEQILPDLLRLVLSLLKNYEIDYDVDFPNYNYMRERNSIRMSIRSSLNSQSNNSFGQEASFSSSQNSTMKDIYYCLFKSLSLFSNDKQIVFDILEYVSNKDKKLLEDLLKEFDENEILKTLTILLKNYCNCKWIYSFFLKVVNLQSHKINDDNFIFKNLKLLNKSLESLQLIYEREKMQNMIHAMYETSFRLLLANNLTNFNENSFQEFFNFSVNCMNYVFSSTNAFSDLEEEKSDIILLINSLITLIFTCSENKNFGMSSPEEKCKVMLIFLKKISHGEIHHHSKTNQYILLRLNRFVEMKNEIAKILFSDELICDFIISVLSNIKAEKKIDETLTKEILHLIIFILNTSDTIQISRFLRENGLLFLMQICLLGVYDFDINKLIIQIIHSLSNSHFKESALIFKNFFAFRTFIIQIKEIKFSKGINEKIYYEILSYLKNIIKSCEYCEAVEETNLIDHLVNEYNEIYCFYIDTKNRILEIISEILSMFSRERNLLKGLLNSKLPTVMENILKYISENPDVDNDKIIEHMMNIFVSFFKSKEYSKLIYNNYKVSLEIIKTIIFSCKLSENCLNKLLTLCQLLVEYENSEIVKDKIVTPVFFRELAMIIPANQKIHKEMIEKCIMLIENPFVDRVRKTINDSNSKLIRELSELVKADRKNAMRKREGGTVTSTYGRESFMKVDEQDDLPSGFNIPSSYKKRKSLININENPNLKVHFENIINNINSITELIIDPERRSEINIEQESEHLGDLLKMLSIFAKNEENIKKISESNIVDKLISIMENNNDILNFVKDQGFNLMERLIEDEDFINNLYENGRACEFFLKELNKICKIYFPENSEYIRNKVFIVTKIISKLSTEKLFLVNNSDYLSISNIFTMLSSIQCDREIILNILVIFNNVLINNSSRDFRNFKVSSVIHNIWKKYGEIRVIEKIMKIIENLYLEESIIRDLLDLDLVENINEVLKSSKTDSEGVLNILEMIDILMFHRYFAAKIIEQKTLNSLINAITINMFNTRIIEKSGCIFLKGARLDKNFITILGVYGIRELCLQILSKYMTTCHSSIIKQTQELIYVLISDENNLNFFSRGENMDIMLKTFKTNLKIREHVLLGLKLINVITTKDVELKIEKTRDKKNTLTKQSTPKSTMVKITSIINTDNEASAITYDFTILIEIINEILSTYDEFIDIIMQLCELINNIFKISNEIWLKKFMMDVIVNNADKYLNKQDYVEVFLNTLHMMIKADKLILDLDCTSILYYIAKILNVKLTYNLVLTMLKILKQVARSKNINTSSNLTEIIKILKFIEETKTFHDDDVILMFSQILGYLCVNTSFYKEVSNEFIVFLLEYLNSKQSSSDIHIKLLEDLKNISVYFHIKSDIVAEKVSGLVLKIFTSNMNDKNKKNLMNVFQVISSLCIQSENMKVSLNEIKFGYELKDCLAKGSFDDTLLEYQAKGCLLNLKLKKTLEMTPRMTNSSTLRSMSIVLSQVEVKDEVKSFLRIDRIVKVYSDKGEAKERFISLNDNLDKISAFIKKKNNIEMHDEMHIKDMDSCVRSCGTAAFSRAKGLFTKKPKPARCFSILGFKSLQGQKTFNVECEKEEDCIKYVDYISMLIQNYKSMKEELAATSDSNFK